MSNITKINNSFSIFKTLLKCSFELSVSFTKGFSLKFSTTNKKDAPSK